ncbi:Chlorhexidine efflux transporter domain-containing protein [Aromatoleum petrolei]|nr:Chlorhexidine efflux transporter domain-containing protein [Aromatoleum petrolei]
MILFEVGGLALITPPFAWLSGVPMGDSVGLLAVAALIAALWNAVYNTAFDWIEGRITGRTADRRPFRMRALHALGFEGGLLLMTLPVIMAWTGMGWVDALIADLGLATAYVIYAFAFNLGYDRVFPIEAPATEGLVRAK